VTVLVPGLRVSRAYRVTDADTALALGSGDLPVLATPRLLAWCEGACVAVITDAATPTGAGPSPGGMSRTPGQTSVGTRVALEHSRPTPVGATVEVQAQLVHVDGRLLRFQVAAVDGDGRTLATGELARVLVETQRFLTRL
jgi:predicted thioesterase